VIDGLGRTVRLPCRPARIVSLVPSLTEALFSFGLREEIVAVTDYCVEPADLVSGVPKVGGTKTPDLDRIERLRPDLVIASAEENVRAHVERLIDAGLTVYISLPLTVRRALDELDDLAGLTASDRPAPAWLDSARQLLGELERHVAVSPPRRYFCPIWRRPYMVAAPDTYMSDLLRVCGGASVFGAGPARYYPVELADAMGRNPDIVLLPSEPYPFAEKHRAEVLSFDASPAVRKGRVYLVDGQLITWYGPRMGDAMRSLATLIGGVEG
jgi:ABC-type Fe3+-hydroxamate transport system substrate-binding protein